MTQSCVESPARREAALSHRIRSLPARLEGAPTVLLLAFAQALLNRYVKDGCGEHTAGPARHAVLHQPRAEVALGIEMGAGEAHRWVPRT